MRMIDADELKKCVVKVCFADMPKCVEFDAVGVPVIDIMPTIDPETLRPTAHWKNEDDYYGDSIIWCCSVCKDRFILNDGTPEENNYKYCPSCGARMVNTDESL